MAELLLFKKGKLLNFTLTFIGCLFFLTTGWGQTVTTDKLDYAPGEIAIISGSGWTGDSMIDIHMDEDPPLHEDHEHDFDNVSVDENGNWSVNFQIEEYHLGVTFYVTVTGQQTGRTAETVFTDGQLSSFTLGSQSSIPVEGTSSTVNYNGSFQIAANNNNVATVTIEVKNLPQGVTYSPSTLSVSGNYTGQNFFTFNLFLTTSGDTPAFPSGTQFEVTIITPHSNGTTSATTIGTLVIKKPECIAPSIAAIDSKNVYAQVDSCGSIVNYDVSTTAGTAPNTYSYSSIGATVINSGSGTGSGTFFNVGVTNVTVTVTNSCGSDTESFTVTVEDKVAPSVVTQNITVQLDADGSATITAAQIDNGSTDNCAIDTYELDVTSFDCSNVGPNTVTLTVTDVNGNEASATATVTVEDKIAPVISCVANQTRANDPGTCSYTVVGDEFDPIFSDNCSANISNNYNSGSTLAGAVFNIGVTTVIWTAKDAAGNETTCSFTVTVTNNDPIITDISGPAGPQVKGTNVILTANYTDNNLANAEWKVYTNDALFTTVPGTIGTETVTGSFNLSPNVYVVKLIITDHCGKTAEAKYEYVVIYDPDGGFVTGGGWIDSPVGASKLYPDAFGKANFGFNAKYKTGKNNTNEVDGNTNFQFKAGNLHFSSSAHNNMSLVISGAKATYTGEGTINGAGNYEFRLIAIDGDLLGNGAADKFRIKIWTKGNPGDVVYDNQRDKSESSDDATELGGGSIVIHKPKSNNKTAEVTEKTLTIAVSEEPIVQMDILGSLDVAPNPVRSDAKVRFTLIEDAGVTVKLYDFNGREIYNLYSGKVKANQVNEAGFQRNNLMSGVYIVRLTTDRGQSYTKQVIIE